MKTLVRTAAALLFVLGLSCHAAQPAPPPAPAAAKPAAAKADPLTEWADGLFAWGAGQTTLEEITTIRIPATRIYIAKRVYAADPRMNDQAHLFVEDGGKVLVGQGEALAAMLFGKGGAGLDGELVQRQVPGAEG